MFGGAIAQRPQIDIHSSAEHRSADGTVWRGKSRTGRCGEAMDCAKSGVGQAQPPNRLASARSSRMPGSAIPSWYARPAIVAERRIPSRASASLNGLARRDSKGSMSWDSASIPLAAMVGRGSRPADLDRHQRPWAACSGLRRLALTPPPDNTELRVTSEPVPAVVGTATQGSPGLVIGRPAPMTSRWSTGSVPPVASTATALADIQRAAAAESENRVAAGSAASATADAHQLDRRLGRDPVAMLEMPASVSAVRTASARDGYGP